MADQGRHLPHQSMSSLMSVMVETSMRMLGPPPPTLSTIPRIGLTTIPWVTDFFGVVLDIWYQYTTWRSSTCECFGCFTLSPAFRAFHPTLWHLPLSFARCLVCVFVCFPLFGLFCKWQRCLTSFFNYTALGDRQCFHARSALR